MRIANKLQSLLRGGRVLLAPPQGLRRADMIAMGCIMASCFFLFQFGDLDYAACTSYAYLEGHFFDFYRYNMATFSAAVPGFGADFLQPIYLLLAAWNAPLKLFGLTGRAAQGILKLSAAELAWTKLLLVVFFALCSVTILKIARLIAGEDEPAKLCMFLFASNPLTIYCIFIFGAFEIFSLAFMMLGLYAFLKNRHWQFIFWFALAIPFKYFAAIPFLPLLLLGEKKVWKILRGLFAAVVPTLVCFTFLVLDQGSMAQRELTSMGFFNFRLLDIGPMMRPAIFVLAYLAICLFAHFKCNDDRRRQEYAVLLPLAAFVLVFACMNWHMQWLILLAPWLALAFLFSPNRSISLLLQTLGTAALFVKILSIYSNSFFPRDGNFLVDPAQGSLEHLECFLGNFWVSSSAGYGALRGFLQPGIFSAGAYIPISIFPYLDVITLLFLLSPFLLQYLQRKNAIWPALRLFKTETGYLRLYCYGGLAAYFLPIAAASAFYAWFPSAFFSSLQDWISTLPNVSAIL